jgi:hypothetical protein
VLNAATLQRTERCGCVLRFFASAQPLCAPLLRLCAVTAQTQQTLAKIDRLLAQAGTSKSNIVEARIWIKDIGKDFKVRSETRASFPLCSIIVNRQITFPFQVHFRNLCVLEYLIQGLLGDCFRLHYCTLIER